MKKIGAAIAAIVALALGSIAIYSQTISSESVPADDEITLHIQLDTEEDVGLLIYDYCANGHEYSGGISNADRSLLKRNEELIVVWNQQALNNPSDSWPAEAVRPTAYGTRKRPPTPALEEASPSDPLESGQSGRRPPS